MTLSNPIRVECRDRAGHKLLTYTCNPERGKTLTCACCGEDVPMAGDELHTIERRK
jgi:hypothetical protein